MLTLSDMSTCGGLLVQYDSTIKFSPGSQDVDVETPRAEFYSAIILKQQSSTCRHVAQRQHPYSQG
jgi:hypothetical protein